MCKYFDYNVVKLKRVRIMNVNLGNLPVGKYRELETHELKTLKRSLDLK